MENHWNALCCYCHDGHVKIDNNGKERVIRAVVDVLRLCARWRAKGHTVRLPGACKLNGIDPEVWLRHLLGGLLNWPSNHVEELLPCNVDLTSV
ncbi:TPA: transposase [Citrobacter freundii]|nr:transposase [Citrobacter freundii]